MLRATRRVFFGEFVMLRRSADFTFGGTDLCPLETTPKSCTLYTLDELGQLPGSKSPSQQYFLSTVTVTKTILSFDFADLLPYVHVQILSRSV